MSVMNGFDFEEERIRQEISRLNAKRVLLQMPEGLKPEASKLAKIVEKSGATPLIAADPCYGACDLAVSTAESLGADLIIHFGHAKMLKHEKIPTMYVEARATIKVETAVVLSIPLLKNYEKIGLATTVQHVNSVDVARKILLRAGKTVEVGNSGGLLYPGSSGC